MITISAASLNHWRAELARSFHQLQPFLEYIGLSSLYSPELEWAQVGFKFRVTRYFADLIEKGKADDPLLLQVLPQLAELEQVAGYELDPLQDQKAYCGGALLQKYHGRALLISTAACAIHCRYCFRRHFPYAAHQWRDQLWQQSLDYIQKHQLKEIILSGGDPLMLSNQQLKRILQDLSACPSIQRIRFHSRLPVVLPQRIDQELLNLLQLKQINCFVLHVNHPNEISSELEQKIIALKRAGITVLNQAVLLKHINDNLAVQVELCEKLFAHGILPYYLHQLDRVAGAAHFAISDEQAMELHQAMQTHLPGYLTPKLVREIPQMKNKQILCKQDKISWV